MSRAIVEAIREGEAGDPEGYKKAIRIADEKVKAALRARRPFEADWEIARAFLFGNTAVEVIGDQLRALPARDAEFRANMIRPRFRTLVSSLTAHKPTFQAVVGDEDDPAARSAAKTANSVLEALRQRTRLQEATQRAVASALLTMRGFIDFGYDATRGAEVELHKCTACDRFLAAEDLVAAAGEALAEARGVPREDEAPRPSADEGPAGRLPDVEAMVAKVCPECGGSVEAVRVRQGDFYTEGLTSWDVVWDPAYDRMANSPWIAIRRFMSKEEAEGRFGGTFDEENVDLGIDLSPPGYGLKVERRGVVIWEMQWRAAPAYPRGVRILWHKERLLDWRLEISGDGDFTVAEILSDEPIGCPFGVGIARDLVVLQIWFNKVGQYLMQHAKLTADPPLVRDEEDAVPDAHDERGSKTMYTRATSKDPKFLSPPVGGGFLQNVLGFLSASMDFIAQQWEPARGQPGAGVTSGLQARILIERAATSLAMLSTSIEQAHARGGKVLIMAAQERMPERRLLAYVGEHGEPKVVRFRDADIRGVIDVFVVAGSAVPESREARREFYLQLLKASSGPSGEMARAIFEAMQTGVKVPADPLQTVRDKAMAEDLKILAGEPVEVSVNDFHDVEIATHLLFESSEEFQRALESPDRRSFAEAHRAHIKAHRDAQALEALETEMKKARLASLLAQSAPPMGGAAGAEAIGLGTEGGIQ